MLERGWNPLNRALMTHPKLVRVFNARNKSMTNNSNTSTDTGNIVNHTVNINGGLVHTLLDKMIESRMKDEGKRENKFAKEKQKAMQKRLLWQK